MKHHLTCDWCSKAIEKYVVHTHNFCSRDCLAAFSSKSKNPDVNYRMVFSTVIQQGQN